jgi:hypothetical protein
LQETVVTDRACIALSMLAGAVLGGLAGFFLFTERGRRFRAELQPHLDEIAKEVQNLQEMAVRVKDTASDGWRQVESLVGDLGSPGATAPGEPRRH